MFEFSQLNKLLSRQKRKETMKEIDEILAEINLYSVKLFEKFRIKLELIEF